MIETENAARFLEQAARLLRDNYDPRQVQELLAPVNAMLIEQLRPSCTCDVRRGTTESWYTSCLLHPQQGEGYVSTSRAIKRLYMTTVDRNGAG